MKLYTVLEARALLPEVVPVLEQLRDAFLALRVLNAAVSAQSRGALGDGALLADPFARDEEDRAEALNLRLRESASRLDDWGIELKDAERGLIDFYHRRPDGKVVFLCYLLGEPTLEHWHTLDGGFAGRQPITEA